MSKKYTNETIEMKYITEPPHQLRMEIGEEGIVELAQSLEQHGLINPITIQRDSEGRLIIIAGHRRFLAAQKNKWEKIEARILDVSTDVEIKTISAIENLQRADMHIIDEANLIADLHFSHELAVNEISDMLNKSRDWVLKRIEIKTYPYEVLQALYEGSLKLGVARRIAVIPEDGFRKWVLTQAVAAGATLSMVNTWINDEQLKTSSKDAQDIIQELSDSTTQYFESTKFTCGLCAQEDSLTHVMILRVCKQCFLQISVENEKADYHKRKTEEAKDTEATPRDQEEED